MSSEKAASPVSPPYSNPRRLVRPDEKRSSQRLPPLCLRQPAETLAMSAHAPHPYRALLNFTAAVPGDEASIAGSRPKWLHEWAPRFKQREAMLQELVAASLSTPNRTQFSAIQIEQRIRTLEDRCLAVMLWPRDAKGDIGDYLLKHTNRLWPAWRKVQTLALQAERAISTSTTGVDPCPGCGSQPAALDVDDVCPSCGAYRFRCGQITHRPLATDATPTVQQVSKPHWVRIPPSEVKRPTARHQRESSPRRLRPGAPKATRRRKSEVAELLILVLTQDNRHLNLNISELAELG